MYCYVFRSYPSSVYLMSIHGTLDHFYDSAYARIGLDGKLISEDGQYSTMEPIDVNKLSTLVMDEGAGPYDCIKNF